MNPAIDLVPIDDLDRAIVTLAARINTETYEQLALIRQSIPAYYPTCRARRDVDHR